ncbi:M56 family metallopeptidase [Paraliomyxa miuraensis]|uniref:M56 family metallopeptidase n=1 Tax=Paraliomyxa miuraensis TaxID=376150 RepID=UPI002254DF88|nr:M56 family metallopeptidase [Paraliomyxa miuraensis]MCX4244292.1 M56 family metallopeptidase [Paraliomyxa miuraensis]
MQASMIAWIVTYLLHSTILVLGAWLLERRWADRPERMSAVWKTALVGGVLTATVQTGLGIAPAAGRLELSPQLASASSSTAPSPMTTEPSVVITDAPSWPPPDWFRMGPVSDASEVIEGPDARTSTVIVPAAAAPSSPSTRPAVESLPSAAVVTSLADAPVLAMGTVTPGAARAGTSALETAPSGWATAGAWGLGLLGAGSLLGLASVLVAFGALRQRLADRRALSEGSLPLLLDGLRRRAGLSQRVPLMVASRVDVPMAVGVLRPEIVVPPKAAHGLTVAHQESLLAHELAHVLRHDPAWRLVALLVERVFFFQPLNRLASRRIAQAAEYLCDDWAARHTQQPLALASCLTEIATWVARPGPVAATMAGPRSILGRRVQRLLQPGPARTRPWWLSAALGLPLLAVVAMAPGVDANAAKPKRSGEPAPLVIIDEDGRRHEVVAPAGGAVVVREHGGTLHVETLDDEEALADEEPSPRKARRAARRQERERDDARRQARKELRRAFRDAKQRGETAPSRREVEAILRRARQADGREQPHRSHRGHRGGAHSESMPEHVEIRVVGPNGVAVHGRVPLGVEELEALEMLEEIEDLTPMLEQIERELEESGIDVVIRHHDGEVAPQLHVVVPSDHARARDRALRDAERARHHHEKTEAKARALRHVQEQRERDVQREVERAHREVERIQRQIERARREQERRHEAELPTVWNRHGSPPAAPAPPAPPAHVHRAPAAPTAPALAPVPRPRAAPRVNPSRRVMPAPAAPAVPSPPSPPAPEESPVVWVTWPG